MPKWKLVNTLSRGHVMFCCFCGTRDLISQFPGFRINLTIVVFFWNDSDFEPLKHEIGDWVDICPIKSTMSGLVQILLSIIEFQINILAE